MGSEILNTDVFIAGGGPAGLAAGIAIRRRGLRVLLADPARPPIDKACGEGLMPNTVASLRLLGVNLCPGDAIPFRGIRFINGAEAAEGAFAEGFGLGIRRTVLHKALAETAVEAGVQCLWGDRVTRITPGEVWLDPRRVRCRWIIAAGGQNSQVRKWAGLDRGRPQQIRYGFRQHFLVSPWADFVEVHWGSDCQVVVTPVRPDEVCLVVTSRSPRFRLKEALAQCPEIARRLKGGSPITRDLGAITALRVMRTVYRGQIALVGDASGSVDSLTGEGLGLAFRQAEALAEAVACNHLARYQAAHRRINRLPEIMSRLLLALENHPKLRRRVIIAMEKEPHLFERLLAVHTGTFSPSTVGFGNLLRLGRRLIFEPS
jgi:flavin-dependent dehydrogenase